MESIRIATRDGDCPAYVFHPDGTGPWPGVLLYMDGLGMGEPIRALAQQIASHGYVVLAPDLFFRAGTYERAPMSMFADPDKRAQWFAKFMAVASPANVMSDTEAYLAYLASRPDVRGSRFGTTGYCMGGTRSLTCAGTFGDRIAAAAAFHPGHLATDAPDSPHLLAPNIKARVYIGAASDDPSFPEAQQQKLAAALTAAGVRHVIETYPAQHGWTMPDTPVYDAACAERHLTALLALFAETLR